MDKLIEALAASGPLGILCAVLLVALGGGRTIYEQAAGDVREGTTFQNSRWQGRSRNRQQSDFSNREFERCLDPTEANAMSGLMENIVNFFVRRRLPPGCERTETINEALASARARLELESRELLEDLLLVKEAKAKQYGNEDSTK